MMACTDKRHPQNSTADLSDSEEFQSKFIEHDMERWYKRILYGIAKSSENETYKCELQSYIRAAFNVTKTRHNDFLDEVIQENSAEICLNIDVIDAQQLDAKNSNGLASPFVTLYIESLPLNQCTSSVKFNTLNPMWEEQFELPLTNGIDKECLIVEVWHFKEAETMREKITSPRKLGKFIKKIATVTTSGNHGQQQIGHGCSILIGRCSIPLKKIPASGLCTSYCLYKNDKPKLRGSITLDLSIGTAAIGVGAKRHGNLSQQDRQHLLRIIVQYELKMSKVQSHCWRGEFSDLAKAILVFSGHTANSRAHALAQWSAFTAYHTIKPLAFELFENLLMALLPILKCHETTTQEELRIFWDGVKKVLPSCFMALRNVQQKNDMKMITESLSIVSTINTLNPPHAIELFPKKIYGWLDKSHGNSAMSSVSSAVEEAIRIRAQDYLLEIAEFRFIHLENIESNLRNIIKVMELIEMDLQRAAEMYNKLFMEKMHCDYTAICYIYYANEMAECFEMSIKRACKRLSRTPTPIMNSSNDESTENEYNTIVTALFDVFLVLKRFAMHSVHLCSESHLKIHNYYEWFADGIIHWLQMHHSIAFKRIKKAIEVDKLMPIDEVVKHSTSTVDTFAIFQPIKEFWLHLNWPDIENAFTFMTKIVDNICHCCVYYAEKMAACITESKNCLDFDCDCNEFHVTPHLCIVINNVNHLRENLSAFIAEFNTEEIISNLIAYRSHADAQRCEQTLKCIVDNAVDTIENKIAELIEYIAYKMCTHLHECLWKAAERLHRDSCLIDQLMENLKKSLVVLSTHLNEMNFKRILAVVWQKFKVFFRALLQNCMNTQCSPQFYTNLYECLQLIIEQFKCNSGTGPLVECEPIVEFERVLRMHSCETDHLIHQYYVERYKQQTKMYGAPIGQLTIRSNFTDDHFLELEILNARNLIPTSIGGSLNPFVQIKFSPNERNNPKIKFRSSVQFKTQFPLFDEQFKVPISKMQLSTENYLIIFSIKNHDRFEILHKYIAECFITFDEIKRCTSKEQIHLTLSRPTSLDCEYLTALKLRESDKIAKKFIKNIKRKLSSPSTNK